METVIAKTKKSFMASYIVTIVFGAILLIFGLVFLLFAPNKFVSIVFIPLGAILLGGGIGWTVYFARLPKNCITFNDGKFRLYNGLEFSPSEVDFCNARSGFMDGGIYNCGTLIISVKNTQYKFKWVEGVEAVAVNINALKVQFTAIEEMQKHIAERKNSEAAQATESADTTENKD